MCKILLIDDSEDDQFMFSRVLRKSGVDAEVVSESSALEALDTVRQNHFDCIFLDYNLPEMNGMAFLKTIRQEHLETPVIMLTGQDDEKTMIKLMQEGAVDYISKNHLNPEVLRLSIINAHNLYESRMQKLKAEEALKISEARLAEAQTIAHVGNWEYSFVDKSLFMSEEARKIMGYTLSGGDHFYFNFLRHVMPQDLLKVMRALKNKKNQDQHDVTFRIQTPEGNTKFIHAKGYVIHNEENNIHITKGTVQDVTVLKNALQDIQKAQIGRKATTIVFGIAIIVFLISEALLDPFVDGLHTSLLIGLSFKGGLALFLKPIESFLEKFMLSRIVMAAV